VKVDTHQGGRRVAAGLEGILLDSNADDNRGQPRLKIAQDATVNAERGGSQRHRRRADHSRRGDEAPGRQHEHQDHDEAVRLLRELRN